MKNPNDEAAFTSEEWAARDRETVKKLSHDTRTQYGLRFTRYNTIIFFRDEEHLKSRREHYELMYDETARLIMPKIYNKIGRPKRQKQT